MGFVRSGNVASGKQKAVNPDRHAGAIGNRIGALGTEVLLRAVFVKSRTLETVNVKIEVIFRRNPVIEDARLQNILGGDGVKPLEVTGFAHADIRGACYQITVLISRRVFAEEGNHFVDLAATELFRFRKLTDIGGVEIDDIGHVDTDLSRDARPVKQNMPRGMGQNGFSERLDLPFRDIDIRLEARREDRPVIIDAADPEHQSGRLADVIALATELEFRSGARRDVAVAGRVNHDLGKDRFPSGLAFRNDARNPVAVHNDIGNLRIKLNRDAGFIHHLKESAFQTLMRNAPAVAFIRILRKRSALAGAVHDFVHQRRSGAAAPVRHHAGCRHASERIGLFHNHDFGSRTCGAERRADSGGTAARHQNFRFSRHWNVSCRFRICFHYQNPFSLFAADMFRVLLFYLLQLYDKNEKKP